MLLQFKLLGFDKFVYCYFIRLGDVNIRTRLFEVGEDILLLWFGLNALFFMAVTAWEKFAHADIGLVFASNLPVKELATWFLAVPITLRSVYKLELFYGEKHFPALGSKFLCLFDVTTGIEFTFCILSKWLRVSLIESFDVASFRSECNYFILWSIVLNVGSWFCTLKVTDCVR